jgi:hypothetical protein
MIDPSAITHCLVAAGTDLGDPVGWVLYAERLHDSANGLAGQSFVMDLTSWQRHGIHEGRPWLPFWENMQAILLHAFKAEPHEVVWWGKPVYKDISC